MMARQHGRGYIREGDYWVIGTEDGRGRDGYTAREAARRYNDHRHPAHVVINNPQDVTTWLNETRDESQITREGVTYPGGYEQASSVGTREPGDVIFYDGKPFIFGPGGLTGVSGFGGRFTGNSFEVDALTISCVTPTPVLALPAGGATAQELDTLYSFVLRPEDLRVAAATVVYEMSCAASIYTPEAVSSAPFAIVSLYHVPMTVVGDALEMSDAGAQLVGSFRVEALSGAGAQGSKQRYEVLQFEPSAGLYTLKYRVSDAGEAGAPDAEYDAFIAQAFVHLRGLNVRAQLQWGAP